MAYSQEFIDKIVYSLVAELPGHKLSEIYDLTYLAGMLIDPSTIKSTWTGFISAIDSFIRSLDRLRREGVIKQEENRLWPIQDIDYPERKTIRKFLDLIRGADPDMINRWAACLWAVNQSEAAVIITAKELILPEEEVVLTAKEIRAILDVARDS